MTRHSIATAALAALAALAVTVIGAVTVPAAAQRPTPTAATISPQLADVPVDTAGFADIHSELLAAVDLAERTRAELADTRAAIPGLRARIIPGNTRRCWSGARTSAPA